MGTRTWKIRTNTNGVLCSLYLALVLVASTAVAQVQPTPNPADRPVSIPKLVPNILADQKRIWLFPVKSVTDEQRKKVLGTMAILSALVATDKYDTPPLVRTTAFNGFNKVASSRNTSIVIAAVPVSMYLAGLVRRDSYMQNTMLLAGEAVADAEILAVVSKAVTRRLRPYQIGPYGDFDDSWFRSNASSGGFPSGHTIAAFSVASVIARRYRAHRWVGWTAYGTAAAIGFSRMTTRQHFPSDVVAGGIFGFSIGRYAVLPP
jgi:membrane-associated phospholipid phosphatase